MHAVGLCTVQPDVTADINDLNAALTTIEKVLDLDGMAERVRELEAQASDPSLWDDPDHAQQVTSQLSHVQAELRRVTELRQRLDDLPILYEFAEEEGDGIEAADEERAAVRAEIETLEVKTMLSGEYDAREALINIRSGAGGVDAADWAEMLLRMYTRYAERNRWQVEIVSANESELGGYKEVIARIVGLGAYSRLKFESGGHRVQRVPATESQGRIHTSACTVAVMPEADELEDIELNPADLRIDTFRASGAGGQHINKTDSAVRITHLPTGMVVECQDGRSQHANKAQAMKVLAARLNDAQKREAQAKEAAERKSLIGSGDRSERIRTYNYPQGRVTDHRINLTLHKLDFVMDGDLEEITNALIAEHQAELLAAMGD